MRWSHDHHRGSGWVPQVCGWNNLCSPVVYLWSTSTTVIIKVAASGYLPHLPFGATGPLGLHEAGCTLEFQLHPYWLALELLVGGGPGAKNIAQLQCDMWLVALPALGDHAVTLPIMTGWLTRLLEFCDGFRRWFFSRWPPHIWLFSWRGIFCEYLQVWKSFLDIFVSLSSVCLKYLEMISPISKCLNSSGMSEFSFLVNWLG